MAVVSSFTYTPDVLIPPSTTITFTDTSTGSPTNWHWDFGDGEISNIQHPTHEFIGISPDIFNVTLKVWTVQSESGASMGGISGTALCTHKVVIDNTDPATIAENAFNTGGYGTLSSTRKFAGNMIRTFADPVRREIRGLRVQFGNTPTSDPLKIPIIKIPLHAGDSWYNRFVGGEGGTCILKRSDPTTWPGSFSAVASADAAGLGRDIVFDLSPWRGISSWFMVTSTELVSTTKDVGNPLNTGWWGSNVQAWNQNINSGDVDDSTQQLIFGVPPIADFTASPKTGPNPLSVQFENLTTLAIGLPTTYVWKKRKSGTADPFTQFSTEENPLEDFGK